jgi:hypothetical protein
MQVHTIEPPTRARVTSPHFSPGGGKIAQGFGFTRDFLKERNNSAYCRLKKIPFGFKEQARARYPGEKCGLAGGPRWLDNFAVNFPDHGFYHCLSKDRRDKKINTGI